MQIQSVGPQEVQTIAKSSSQTFRHQSRLQTRMNTIVTIVLIGQTLWRWVTPQLKVSAIIRALAGMSLRLARLDRPNRTRTTQFCNHHRLDATVPDFPPQIVQNLSNANSSHLRSSKCTTSPQCTSKTQGRVGATTSTRTWQTHSAPKRQPYKTLHRAVAASSRPQ